MQAVNNIVDALEAQVSSPETIVAELASACSACHALPAVTLVSGQRLPPAQRRPSLATSMPSQSLFYLCFLFPPLCLQARVMEDQKKFVSVPATTVIPLAQQAAAAVSAEVEASGGQQKE